MEAGEVRMWGAASCWGWV
uniref:Uncharacterized protein n=1 Tax=Anguilla anguilla TaxID=7936 RepID=A0A0E9RYP3_ANGAN